MRFGAVFAVFLVLSAGMYAEGLEGEYAVAPAPESAILPDFRTDDADQSGRSTVRWISSGIMGAGFALAAAGIYVFSLNLANNRDSEGMHAGIALAISGTLVLSGSSAVFTLTE